MTWLLVRTRPLDESTMPVPSAVASLYVSLETTSTMPGSTWGASALAFSGPVPPLVPPWLDPPLVGSGNGLAPLPLPLPLPPWPKGLACDPLPPIGETAADEVVVWLSASAAPAPAPAASTATAT